jgi:hypothetical protein
LECLSTPRADIEGEEGYEALWKKPVLEFLTQTFDSGFNWDQIMRGTVIKKSAVQLKYI